MKNESLTQTLVVVVSYETKIKFNWTSYILILFKPCLFCTPKKNPQDKYNKIYDCFIVENDYKDNFKN